MPDIVLGLLTMSSAICTRALIRASACNSRSIIPRTRSSFPILKPRPRSVETCFAYTRGFQGSAQSTPPGDENSALKGPSTPAAHLGTANRLPEYNLHGKVVLVSGAAQGLGLVQAEALLEAGATVYALDRRDTPSADFSRVQKRASEELGTKFEYRRIDVRNTDELNQIVEQIAEEHGRLDGLVAAAGIQQETTALDYTAEDAK